MLTKEISWSLLENTILMYILNGQKLDPIKYTWQLNNSTRFCPFFFVHKCRFKRWKNIYIMVCVEAAARLQF